MVAMAYSAVAAPRSSRNSAPARAVVNGGRAAAGRCRGDEVRNVVIENS
jgi:hypothetical protein